MNLFKKLEDCNEGVFHFHGGEVCWTFAIEEGGEWFIRYESGWYVEVYDDGKRGSPGTIIHKDGTNEVLESTSNYRDVKLFEPMGYHQAMIKYPNIQIGLMP